MAAVRRKTAQDLPVETPIGGWNTRDAIDNVPPSDALVMDNWLPDLGSVKVRKGYIEHSDSLNMTTGGELVLNPGFETLGGGGTDTFANWVEAWGTGAVVDGTPYVHSGSRSCEFTAGYAPGPAPSATQVIAVTALQTYRLIIWSMSSDAAPGIPFPPYGEYAVYDVSNAAYIVPKTTIVQKASLVWQKLAVEVKAPVGCVSLRIELWGSDPIAASTRGNHGAVFFDDISLYAAHATGDVESLMVFDHEGDYKMLAADGGSIYNASTATPVQLGSGFNNSRWDWSNFNDLIVMCNGVDIPQQYDGTTLGNISPLLTGPTAPVGCHAFKYRMYYWDADSQDVWYTALYAAGGVCTKFALSQVGKRGGDLVAMFTWTHDGGSGSDDFAVFMMSSGETLVYQGSSPSSVADWALVGIYDVGVPLGRRCGAKFGGDLLIMTTLDFLPLSQAISGKEALSRRSKISGAVRDVIANAGFFGWDVKIFPEEQLMICNIPIVEGQTYYQYVLNLVTGAWCRFKGLLAHCWINYNGKMYFGTDDGVIHEAFSGYTDLTEAIQSDLQTAWLTFNVIANKQCQAIQQTFRSDVPVSYNAVVSTDFKAFPAIGYPMASEPTGSAWDTSPWDTSPWGSVVTVEQAWKVISGFGRFISMYTKTATKSVTELLSNIWHLGSGDRM
jgi:hypothetical protein